MQAVTPIATPAAAAGLDSLLASRSLGPADPGCPQPTVSAPPSGDQLKELTAAVDGGEVPTHDPAWEAPPRVGRLSATWIAAALLIAAILALMWLAQLRNKDTTPTGPATPPTAALATDE